MNVELHSTKVCEARCINAIRWVGNHFVNTFEQSLNLRSPFPTHCSTANIHLAILSTAGDFSQQQHATDFKFHLLKYSAALSFSVNYLHPSDSLGLNIQITRKFE